MGGKKREGTEKDGRVVFHKGIGEEWGRLCTMLCLHDRVVEQGGQ